MPARRRDLERALGGGVAADLGEVGADRLGHGRASGRCRHRLDAAHVIERLLERVDADHRHPFERRRFAGVGARHDELVEPLRGGERRHRQSAADRAQPAVEAELAAEEPPREVLDGEQLVRRDQTERDGQIEVAAFLA